MTIDEIKAMSNEDLVEQFYRKAESSSRWISGDEPEMDEELRAEILQRMRHA